MKISKFQTKKVLYIFGSDANAKIHLTLITVNKVWPYYSGAPNDTQIREYILRGKAQSVDLLIKVACFVKIENYIFNIKMT